MFNPFHNYVMEQLTLLDENGSFSTTRLPAWSSYSWNRIETRYDNALSKTGRLMASSLYIQIILKGYVRKILSLNRTDNKWVHSLYSADGKKFFGGEAGEAVGNQVSRIQFILSLALMHFPKRDQESISTIISRCSIAQASKCCVRFWWKLAPFANLTRYNKRFILGWRFCFCICG